MSDIEVLQRAAYNLGRSLADAHVRAAALEQEIEVQAEKLKLSLETNEFLNRQVKELSQRIADNDAAYSQIASRQRDQLNLAKEEIRTLRLRLEQAPDMVKVDTKPSDDTNVLSEAKTED